MEKLFEFIAHIGRYRVLIQSRDISDGAVVTNKLADNSVDAQKIKDAVISWGKLDDNVKNIIVTSAGQHGIPLSNEFGYSDILGISQRVITEKFDELQDLINNLHPGNLGVSAVATPNIVYNGSASSVTIKVRMLNNSIAERITVTVGDEVIEEDNVSEIERTIEVEGEVNVDVLATQEGFTYDAHTKVKGTYPYYVGSAETHEEIIGDDYMQPIKANPDGTYNINVPQDGCKVYFIVPATMEINEAIMSGFEFPLDDPVATTVEGVDYKMYASSNTYDEGLITITIS